MIPAQMRLERGGRATRRRRRLLIALLGAVTAACLACAGTPRAARAQAGEQSLWLLQVSALGGFPTSPSDFGDGWNGGLGLEGGLRRRLGVRAELGVEAQFVQFGFDSPGGDVNGGARRFGRFVVPLHFELWRRGGAGQDRVTVEASAGYVHQSIETVSGLEFPPTPGGADGFACGFGLNYSRHLYQQTRLVFGVRQTFALLPDETPGYFTLQLGAQAPLAGKP